MHWLSEPVASDTAADCALHVAVVTGIYHSAV